jgi:hypothetical protein
MRRIIAPDIYVGQPRERRLFLAGGITGAPLWQNEFCDLIADTDLVVFDPRREGFDVRQKDINREQIGWEFRHLNMADAISFWFPYPALCAISLFELGAWANNDVYVKIYVGVDPQYIRREDVEIQLSLYRPEIKIAYSLRELADQIKLDRSKGLL